jgi:hypothetical protein
VTESKHERGCWRCVRGKGVVGEKGWGVRLWVWDRGLGFGRDRGYALGLGFTGNVNQGPTLTLNPEPRSEVPETQIGPRFQIQIPDFRNINPKPGP